MNASVPALMVSMVLKLIVAISYIIATSSKHSHSLSNASGMSLKESYGVLMLRVNMLPEVDRSMLMAKLAGGEPFRSLQEKNTLLMMLLRAHCEAKQAEHSHVFSK